MKVAPPSAESRPRHQNDSRAQTCPHHLVKVSINYHPLLLAWWESTWEKWSSPAAPGESRTSTSSTTGWNKSNWARTRLHTIRRQDFLFVNVQNKFNLSTFMKPVGDITIMADTPWPCGLWTFMLKKLSKGGEGDSLSIVWQSLQTLSLKEKVWHTALLLLTTLYLLSWGHFFP